MSFRVRYKGFVIVCDTSDEVFSLIDHLIAFDEKKPVVYVSEANPLPTANVRASVNLNQMFGKMPCNRGTMNCQITHEDVAGPQREACVVLKG